jgi:hypothetical protein
MFNVERYNCYRLGLRSPAEQKRQSGVQRPDHERKSLNVLQFRGLRLLIFHNIDGYRT